MIEPSLQTYDGEKRYDNTLTIRSN